jgi:Undecaprenyl-phosphate glucose phosphotransferase
MKVKKQSIIFGYITLELLLLNLAAAGAVIYKSVDRIEHLFAAFATPDFFQLLAIFNFSWILISILNGNQELYMVGDLKQRFKETIINSFILLGMSSTAILLTGLERYALTILLGPVFIFSAANIGMLLLVNRLMGKGKPGGKSFGQNLLILGAGPGGKQVQRFSEDNKHLGYRVIGFLDDQYPGSNGIQLLGKLDDLPRVLDSHPVDELVITLSPHTERAVRSAIDIADYRGIRVTLVPDYVPTYLGERFQSYTLGSLPVMQLKQIPLDQFHNYFLKKGFDLFFALTVLTVLAPLITLIAILIKLNSRGGVFHKPTRKGQGNLDFTMLKFRTMYEDQGDLVGLPTQGQQDPRVTPIGRILRRYSLDELPQFINVLRGEMSVVGPRPHRLVLSDEFQEMVDKYMVRHYVKPGITGWAQVNGWRGPTHTMEQKLSRVQHDLWYIENWSFWLDLKIIWLTIFGRKTRFNAF